MSGPGSVHLLLGLIKVVFIQFTASGYSFAAGEFAAKHSLSSASLWQKGQAHRFGRVHNDAGFGLSLPDVETPIAAFPLIEAFVEENTHWLSELRQQGSSASLRLGVTVGEEQSFAPTIEFSTALLHRLASTGISLAVTGYPASDEAQPTLLADGPASGGSAA